MLHVVLCGTCIECCIMTCLCGTLHFTVAASHSFCGCCTFDNELNVQGGLVCYDSDAQCSVYWQGWHTAQSSSRCVDCTQGMGWTCIEELIWGDKDHKWVRPGTLQTRGPGELCLSRTLELISAGCMACVQLAHLASNALCPVCFRKSSNYSAPIPCA